MFVKYLIGKKSELRVSSQPRSVTLITTLDQDSTTKSKFLKSKEYSSVSIKKMSVYKT
jgi:hypothetical protein